MVRPHPADALLKPSARAVVKALRDAGVRGCDTGDLADVAGVRFGARVAECRAAGFEISEVRVRQGRHLYRLNKEPAAPVHQNGSMFITGCMCPRCGRHRMTTAGRCAACDRVMRPAVVMCRAETMEAAA